MKAIDITGKRFGRLTVIDRAFTESSRAHWNCLCDCGSTSVVCGKDLRSGNTKSCGCWRVDNGKARRTHGFQSNEFATIEHRRFYKVWMTMHWRCRSTRASNYNRYGGRGICVSQDWHKFESFKRDMWPRPTPRHQIDRIDNSKGYEKGNCRWVLPKENSRNRRNNFVIEYGGKSMTLAELSESTGIPSPTLRARIIRLGWSVERATTTPVTKRINK